MSRIRAVYDKAFHSNVRGIQFIARFPQMFPYIQTACNPKKHSRLQIRFFPKSSPAKVASAVYPAKAQYRFTPLDISIIVFKHPVRMGVSLGTQRSHLPLLQYSIIMKALQCSSSKPFPFREARNLETRNVSCHVRISMSSR